MPRPTHRRHQYREHLPPSVVASVHSTFFGEREMAGENGGEKLYAVGGNEGGGTLKRVEVLMRV